jgi:hypothetical protein
VPLAGRRFCLVAALWLAAAPAAAEWVDFIAEAELAFQYDSNLNRAGFGADEEWDLSWHPRLELGRVYQIGDATRLDVSAEVRGEIHHRFSSLDAVAGDGKLSLFHKFGLGPAPWVRVFYAGGYLGVQDLPRSGPRFVVGAEVGKRFSSRFDASLAYHYTNRSGVGGPPAPVAGPGPGPGGPGLMTNLPDDVFDQETHVVTLSGSFLLTEDLLLTAGFGYRRGDFDSNARTNLTGVVANEDVEAVARDQVFGGWVYRIVGNAYAPFASLNYGLSERFSLDLGYRFQYGEGDWLSYANHMARLAVLFRY